MLDREEERGRERRPPQRLDDEDRIAEVPTRIERPERVNAVVVSEVHQNVERDPDERERVEEASLPSGDEEVPFSTEAKPRQERGQESERGREREGVRVPTMVKQVAERLADQRGEDDVEIRRVAREPRREPGGATERRIVSRAAHPDPVRELRDGETSERVGDVVHRARARLPRGKCEGTRLRHVIG